MVKKHNESMGHAVGPVFIGGKPSVLSDISAAKWVCSPDLSPRNLSLLPM